ncbi:MAG: ABC transporter permease [Pseudomonadota bacterium]
MSGWVRDGRIVYLAMPVLGLLVLFVLAVALLDQGRMPGVAMPTALFLAALFGLVIWAIARNPGLPRWLRALPPLLFGLALVMIWEVGVRVHEVPMVILPAPSQIGAAMAGNAPMLWADFVQTVLRSALPGYLMGCGAAVTVAILIDRTPFLQRGLLPVANLASALPIVGIAPIMVMWFGFDWQSKAAVVVLMCFFPMLVNTMQGLASADRMQADLMRTYAASYWQTLLLLRLPAAAPMIFTGLKICTTLALIGAIVAEFFGTPIVGMGFRISTEVGRLALDVVWAEIAVAALTGTAFYGAITLLERAVTFWHPSQRG